MVYKYYRALMALDIIHCYGCQPVVDSFLHSALNHIVLWTTLGPSGLLRSFVSVLQMGNKQKKQRQMVAVSS